jgi:hypothetical protein
VGVWEMENLPPKLQPCCRHCYGSHGQGLM